MLVDIAGRKLVFSNDPTSVVIQTFLSALHCAFQLATPLSFQKLLSQFPDVLSSDGFKVSKPHHGVRHHPLTNLGPPVFAKPQKLDPEKQATAQTEFSAMEEAGIIRRSSSPWSSLLHMAKKEDGVGGPSAIIEG